MSLDSDIANADAQLHVEFYEYTKDDAWKGKPYVRIMVPGDKTNIVDRPARESDKVRFQRQWMHFQMNRPGGEVIGTPLYDWHKDRPDELTEGQLAELTILKFLSVEQVAMASDTQIMRVGMGAAGVRERARAYLSSKNAQASGAELEALKAQIAALTAQVAGQTAAPKGGWPKKEQAQVSG